MATIQVTTDDLRWTKSILQEEDQDQRVQRIMDWLDYMIAGLEQAEEVAKKEWITKE